MGRYSRIIVVARRYLLSVVGLDTCSPFRIKNMSLITADELANLIVNDYMLSNEQHSIDEMEILRSSRLAVALEHLNLIRTDGMREYAGCRGGTIFIGNTKPVDQVEGEIKRAAATEMKTLSFRNILFLLKFYEEHRDEDEKQNANS